MDLAARPSDDVEPDVADDDDRAPGHDAEPGPAPTAPAAPARTGAPPPALPPAPQRRPPTAPRSPPPPRPRGVRSTARARRWPAATRPRVVVEVLEQPWCDVLAVHSLALEHGEALGDEPVVQAPLDLPVRRAAGWRARRRPRRWAAGRARRRPRRPQPPTRPATAPRARSRRGRSRGTRSSGSRAPAPTASRGTRACPARRGSTSRRRTRRAPGSRRSPRGRPTRRRSPTRRGALRRARRSRRRGCRRGGRPPTSRRRSSRRLRPSATATPRSRIDSLAMSGAVQTRSSSARPRPTCTTPPQHRDRRRHRAARAHRVLDLRRRSRCCRGAAARGRGSCSRGRRRRGPPRGPPAPPRARRRGADGRQRGGHARHGSHPSCGLGHAPARARRALAHPGQHVDEAARHPLRRRPDGHPGRAVGQPHRRLPHVLDDAPPLPRPHHHLGREVPHDVLDEPEVCRPGQFQRLLGSRTGRPLAPAHRRGQPARAGRDRRRSGAGAGPVRARNRAHPGRARRPPRPSRTAYASGVAATSHHHWSTKAAGTWGGTGTPWSALLLRLQRVAPGLQRVAAGARPRGDVGAPHRRVRARRHDGR